MHWTIWLFLISLIIILPLVFIFKSIIVYPSYRDRHNKTNGESVLIPYWVLLVTCVCLVIPIVNIIGSIFSWTAYIIERSGGDLEYVDFDLNKLPQSFKNIICWLNKTW